MPNGETIGYAMGDFNPYDTNDTIYNTTSPKSPVLAHRATASETEIVNVSNTSHPWGVFFTIIGTVLLDFDADACQSPSRAYLLDVTVPEDHARGLSTFTIMAGLGGFMGYSLGAINWEETSFGNLDIDTRICVHSSFSHSVRYCCLFIFICVVFLVVVA